MGWLWSSAPASEPSERAPLRNDAPESASSVTEAKVPITSHEPQSAAIFPKRTREPTRDELAEAEAEAEAELQSFLQSIESASELSLPSAPSSTNRFPSGSLQDPTDPATPTSLTSAHTLPSTISCRTFFDNAIHCQSPGGQFLNVYRYGSLRDCTEIWYDFLWCMRTNRGSMTEQERAERIRKRWSAKEQALRNGDNSEEVWEERKVLLRGVWQEQYPEEEIASQREGQRGTGRGSMKGLYGG